MLGMQLDQAQDSGFQAVDRNALMSELEQMKSSSTTEIHDLKKARALLKSVITSDPKSASGWIAAARVEELDGKLDEARSIITNACRNFYDNEDIWLESARLNPAERAKTIIG